jgi:hypothetical protein
MRKTFTLALLTATLVGSVGHAASGESAPTKPAIAAKPALRPAGKPKVEPAESKPVPDLKLTIETSTTRGPWRMRVENAGDVPVRIVADARLLTLEVSPRSARASTRCELPGDMRPSDDLERTLVVPPGRSYAESFEPRLYCFGKKLDVLAPGAVLVAHLGWAGGKKGESPFEVSAIEGVTPEVAPLKSIDAPPVALPDEPSVSMVEPAGAESDWSSDTPRLSIQGPPSLDSFAPGELEVPVTLRNEGARSAVVRFRPEVVGFDVVGPAGVEHCMWPTMPAAAMRELFSTLPTKGSETLNLMLQSYCTKQGLDQSGLLVVRPRLDTRNASGEAVGLQSFDGEVIAMTPTLVRLHRGAKPPAFVRPRLEPAP